MTWTEVETSVRRWWKLIGDIDVSIECNRYTRVDLYKWEVSRSDGINYNASAHGWAKTFEQAEAQAMSIVKTMQEWPDDDNQISKTS